MLVGLVFLAQILEVATQPVHGIGDLEERMPIHTMSVASWYDGKVMVDRDTGLACARILFDWIMHHSSADFPDRLAHERLWRRVMINAWAVDTEFNLPESMFTFSCKSLSWEDFTLAHRSTPTSKKRYKMNCMQHLPWATLSFSGIGVRGLCFSSREEAKAWYRSDMEWHSMGRLEYANAEGPTAGDQGRSPQIIHGRSSRLITNNSV